MKTTSSILIMILSVIIVLSCEKDDDNDNLSLRGKWLNVANNNEYIEFTSATGVTVNGVDFTYTAYHDWIVFNYAGNALVLCRESKLKYWFYPGLKSLKIEHLDDLYMVNGTPGITEYIKQTAQ